jgi:DNA topoisomerase VI subunit A
VQETSNCAKHNIGCKKGSIIKKYAFSLQKNLKNMQERLKNRRIQERRWQINLQKVILQISGRTEQDPC